MFIVFDGPDGCGKTTLAKALVKHINSKGIQAVYTFEPTTESIFGQEIRKTLKNSEIYDIVKFSDLFNQDRKYHLDKFIIPNLEKNIWVICDRYKYSALAYQQLQHIDAQSLIDSNSVFLIPDIVFIILPKSVDVLFNRIEQRGIQTEYFEKRSYLEKVIKIYNSMPTYFPNEKIFFLSAELSIEDNIVKIEEILADYSI